MTEAEIKPAKKRKTAPRKRKTREDLVREHLAAEARRVFGGKPDSDPQ